MVVKTLPECGERFAARLEWIAILVVEKNALT
jgi:hypothetical protein